MLTQKKLCQIPSSCSVTFLARKESPFVRVQSSRTQLPTMLLQLVAFGQRGQSLTGTAMAANAWRGCNYGAFLCFLCSRMLKTPRVAFNSPNDCLRMVSRRQCKRFFLLSYFFNYRAASVKGITNSCTNPKRACQDLTMEGQMPAWTSQFLATCSFPPRCSPENTPDKIVHSSRARK